MTFGGRDNRGPSIAELQRFVREHAQVVFMLSNGRELEGTLRWFDESAFQVQPLDSEQPFTILRAAVVGYRRSGGGSAAPVAQANRVQAACAVESGGAGESKASADTEVRADDIGGN